ncbi:MAG: xanthine dehydrogenase family protein molybdopterin-binding subunit, partial [Stellaceae bacterium]
TMEPRGVMAQWDAAAGRLTVSGAAKVPFFNRRILAAQMGLDESAVDMIELDVGGGFGARGEFYPEDFLIPFAARRTGRPVKWTEDRRENLIATQHARDIACEIEIACERDGTILGLRGRTVADLGAYLRTNGLVGPRNVAQFLAGPYRVPNISIDAWAVLTNKTPSGTYRGPGRFEGDFFRERLLDLAAKDLGIDRVEFRLRNLVADAEMPYPLPAITPYESVTELDSGDYQAVLQRCLAEFGWAEKTRLDGKLIDGRYHGTGVACFVEGGAAGPRENARLVIENDGAVSVYVGSSAIGQGLETVFGQIAADALELPMDRIRVYHGSTTYVSEGFGSYHSRASVMGGSAILLAAAKLKDEIRNAAAKHFGCAPAEVEIREDRVWGSAGRTATLGELAGGGLEAEASFASHKYTYTYGAHAAHVAVDHKTGHVAILDYLAIEDVGRIMNPLTLHGQVIGSLVQGLGGTFLERFAYDQNGQLLSGTFADYLMPTASDFPNLRAVSLELKPSPNNPLGAKGAGEGGIIPAGGVIANAVAAALAPLRCEPRELPLSPPRLWEMIQDARRAAAAD